MWLEALQLAPELQISDQVFKDHSRIRLGVRAFTTDEPWTCICGHHVREEDVAHALLGLRLVGLVQRRQQRCVLRDAWQLRLFCRSSLWLGVGQGDGCIQMYAPVVPEPIPCPDAAEASVEVHAPE